MTYFAALLERPGRLLLTACASLLVLGCNSEPPETVGQQMGAVLCKMRHQHVDAEYNRDMQLATEIEAGKIKTHLQLYDRYTELSAAVPDDNPTEMMARNDSIAAELSANFPNQAERQVADSVIALLINQCTADLQAQRRLRPDPQLRQLRAQLTGPLPTLPTHDAAGNELPPPLNNELNDSTNY